MANKLIKVCDVCGEVATNSIKIDVCKTHERLGLAEKAAKRRRRVTQKVPCEICGKLFAPQGLPGHMRTQHAPAEEDSPQKD